MIYIYLYMLAIGGSIALAVTFEGGRWFWATLAFVMILIPAGLLIYVLETVDWSNMRMG